MEQFNESIITNKTNKLNGSNGFSDYFSFQKMISSIVIQIIYVIGAIVIIIFSIVMIIGDLNGEYTSDGIGSAWGGVLLLTLGNIIWRVFCEVWIIFFRIAEDLSKIEKSCKK